MTTRRRQGDVADVGGRRQVAVLRVGSRAARRTSGSRRVGGGAAAPRQLTTFKSGRVLWPSISQRRPADRVRARLRDLDPRHRRRTRRARVADHAARRAGRDRRRAPDAHRRTSPSSRCRRTARRWRSSRRGEVFAASAKDGGDAARISRTPENEVARRRGRPTAASWSTRRIARRPRTCSSTTSATDTETRLTSGADADHSAALLARRKARSRSSAATASCARSISRSKQERLLARGVFDRPPFAGEPPFAGRRDNRWLAYLVDRPKVLHQRARRRPPTARAPRPASFLANSFANTISWSPDGKAVYFDTGQRTEAQADRAHRPARRARRSSARISSAISSARSRCGPPPSGEPTEGRAAPTAPSRPTRATPPATPDRRPDRVRRHPPARCRCCRPASTPASQRISPDGKTLLLIGRAAGQQNLYTFSIDELSREPAVARQLTSTPGGKSDAEFTPDGKEVFFLEQGRISVDHRREPAVAAARRHRRDGRRLRAREDGRSSSRRGPTCATTSSIRKFNGVDWQAVRAQYAPLIAGAATRDEMRRLLNLMVGELNASHLGRQRAAGGGGARGRQARAALRSPRIRAERPLQDHRRDSAHARRRWPASRPASTCSQVDGTTLGAARQPRSGAEPHDQPPRRARRRRRCGRRQSPHRRGAARPTRRRRRTSRTGSGSRRTAPTWPRRAAAASATCTCSTCRRARSTSSIVDLDAENHSRDGVVDRRPQQQRRLRQHVRARRVHAAELPDDDAARRPVGARPQPCSGSGRSARRRSSSPTSTRCPTPRTSPKAIAR